MILVCHAMAGHKLSVAKGKIIEVDAKGCVEVSDKDVIGALMVSGFKEVIEQKKSKAIKAEPKAEEPGEPVAPEAPVEASKKGRWSRG